MTDEYEFASDIEERERQVAVNEHARRMAAIKPADDCRHCGEGLTQVRIPWGTCIECARQAEKIARGCAR